MFCFHPMMYKRVESQRAPALSAVSFLMFERACSFLFVRSLCCLCPFKQSLRWSISLYKKSLLSTVYYCLNEVFITCSSIVGREKRKGIHSLLGQTKMVFCSIKSKREALDIFGPIWSSCAEIWVWLTFLYIFILKYLWLCSGVLVLYCWCAALISQRGHC